jgi:hypothetical protein
VEGRKLILRLAKYSSPSPSLSEDGIFDHLKILLITEMNRSYAASALSGGHNRDS